MIFCPGVTYGYKQKKSDIFKFLFVDETFDKVGVFGYTGVVRKRLGSTKRGKVQGDAGNSRREVV
ncbi:MAG: hypothetical protein UV30_C0016G0005 [Candidatus Collierbacteria bacterium GW2011_GWF1_42_50]|nr:MAG: hypothetical protein UV30_C0016G0005 [Candidatus Collierbacteria bacterium GW2011_GWF1_42_50]